MSGPWFAALLDPRYHVPRSQVWEGSRGRASGCVHLHVTSSVEFGRIHREPQQALCGKRGSYERPAEGERLCPRCEALSVRLAALVLSVCPSCGGYVEDLDGFGVLAHDACGYCSHPEFYGGVCTICGAREEVALEVQNFRDRIDAFVAGRFSSEGMRGTRFNPGDGTKADHP